jgi:phage terminase Nu1 subunit (DNA packaging protein)
MAEKRTFDDLTCSASELACFLGLSTSRISQLVRSGVIKPPSERGKYGLKSSVSGYTKFLQSRSLGSAAPENPDFYLLKCEKIRLESELLTIEAARKSGEVCEIEFLERGLSNLIIEVRTNLRNIPARIVSSILGETSEKLVKKIILQEIDQSLTALAEIDVSKFFAE